MARTLYGVLDLPPQADEGEIKAAFRKLAKQFHPDLRNGDKRAEQRFKEINEAHAILIDPDARARYDARLSHEQSLKRRRVRNAAMMMATSFALTVTLISTAIVWRQYGSGLSLLSADRLWAKSSSHQGRVVAGSEDSSTSVAGERTDGQRTVVSPSTEHVAGTAIPLRKPSVDGALAETPSSSLKENASADQESGSGVRPPAQETERSVRTAMEVEHAARSGGGRLPLPIEGPSTGVTSQTEVPAQEAGAREEKTDASVVPPTRADAASWASYSNARFGFSLRYPADIFVADPAQSDENVRRFLSRDGRAVLQTFATPNLAGRTLTQYRTALIQERYAKATFDYAPQRDTWFVLSGGTKDDIFYERVTFSCDRRLFHGWRLVFPSSERLPYEAIIEEMHRNYRHSNGPGARCGAVKPQISVGAKLNGSAEGPL